MKGCLDDRLRSDFQYIRFIRVNGRRLKLY